MGWLSKRKVDRGEIGRRDARKRRETEKQVGKEHRGWEMRQAGERWRDRDRRILEGMGIWQRGMGERAGGERKIYQ